MVSITISLLSLSSFDVLDVLMFWHQSPQQMLRAEFQLNPKFFQKLVKCDDSKTALDGFENVRKLFSIKERLMCLNNIDISNGVTNFIALDY